MSNCTRSPYTVEGAASAVVFHSNGEMEVILPPGKIGAENAFFAACVAKYLGENVDNAQTKIVDWGVANFKEFVESGGAKNAA